MKRAWTTLSALALALILAIAALNIWRLGPLWIAHVAKLDLQFSNTRFVAPMSLMADKIVVLRDGAVLIHSIEFVDRNTVVSYRTLENEPALAPKDPGSYLSGTTVNPAHWGRPPLAPHPWTKRISAFVVPPGIRRNRPPAREFWYFVHDGLVDGSGYFVGYDALSNNRIGFWGTDKELAEQPPGPDDRFHCEAPRWDHVVSVPRNSQSYAANSPLILFGADRVQAVDVPRRVVATLWQGDPIVNYELLSSGNLPQKDDEIPNIESRFVVRTEHQLHFVSNHHKDDYAIDIPEAMRHKVLRLWEFPKKGIVATAESSLGRNGVIVAKIPKSGAPTIVEVPLRDLFPLRDLYYDRPNDWPFLALKLPSPVALIGYWAAGAWEWQSIGRADTWCEAFSDEWPRIWPTLLTAFAVSGVFAYGVWRRQRQFGLGNENLWAAFVLLAGPAGAFAYLVHRAWPVREACPACGVKAPRDREACFRCGAEFPGPQHFSTEIRA